MEIITFHSYKGGAGRSLSLANVATSLHIDYGKTVAVLDLDWEAAALADLFRVRVTASQSILDLLVPANRTVTNLERHVLPIPSPQGSPGALYLLPAVTDSRLVDEIHWDKGVEVFLRDDVFPTLERLYNLDYLLIDARSGISTFARFALTEATLVVLVGRADLQNRQGLAKLVTVCRAAAKPFLLLACGVPEPERNRRRLEEFETAVKAKLDYIVPYRADLYFEEKIVTRNRGNTDILAQRYRSLANHLVTRK
jgi:MinD-like ATPase involved in chromosome partitioning or flagellar assembly